MAKSALKNSAAEPDSEVRIFVECTAGGLEELKNTGTTN
jgi:hypothetical protein